MSASSHFDQASIRDVERAISLLPRELQKSAETAALRAGAAPIHKAAKRHAASNKDSGLLQRSITTSVKTVRGEKSARIGPRTGMRQMVTREHKKTGKKYKVMADPNNYSHLVEYGTTHSAAKPFIRPAINETASETLVAMANSLDLTLTKVVARLKK